MREAARDGAAKQMRLLRRRRQVGDSHIVKLDGTSPLLDELIALGAIRDAADAADAADSRCGVMKRAQHERIKIFLHRRRSPPTRSSFLLRRLSPAARRSPAIVS